MHPVLTKPLFAAAMLAFATALPMAAHARAAGEPATSAAADGALRLAGLDRRGVSSDPAHRFESYTDGARARRADGFTEGALRLAGMDRNGVSSDPAHRFDSDRDGFRASRDPYTDGALRLAGMDTRGVSAAPGRTAEGQAVDAAA